MSLLWETSTTTLLLNSNDVYMYVGLEFCWSRANWLIPLPPPLVLVQVSMRKTQGECYNGSIGLVWCILRCLFIYLDTMQIDLNNTSDIIVSRWQIAQRFYPKFSSPPFVLCWWRLIPNLAPLKPWDPPSNISPLPDPNKEHFTRPRKITSFHWCQQGALTLWAAIMVKPFPSAGS